MRNVLWTVLGVFLYISTVWAASPSLVGKELSAELELADGGRFVVQAQRGHWQVIAFWASWCEPCKQELPELQALYERFSPQGLQLIAVSIDDARSQQRAIRFAKSKGLTMPIALDPAGTLQLAWMHEVVLPCLVVIDPEGRVRLVEKGYARARGQEVVAQIAAWLTP